MDFSFEAASLQARIIECVELHLVQLDWSLDRVLCCNSCTIAMHMGYCKARLWHTGVRIGYCTALHMVYFTFHIAPLQCTCTWYIAKKGSTGTLEPGSDIVLHHCTSYSPCNALLCTNLHFALLYFAHKLHHCTSYSPCSTLHFAHFAHKLHFALYFAHFFIGIHFGRLGCSALHSFGAALQWNLVSMQSRSVRSDASGYIAGKRAVSFRALHCI